ncbi:MAG TPA: TenA family protein [Nocardioidaceae bacterium]|nr:TenA family protein [Nocardioidaceae bacterium]
MIAGSLSSQLFRLGEPMLQEQLRHPTVVGLARGDLGVEVFRGWIEQDYLYLTDFVRVFSRLAWQAPPEHLPDLVDMAHSTWHEELALHRELAAPFGARLDSARKGPTCMAYTSFVLDAAADYGRGLAAVLPCMWGYSQLGQRLAQDPPHDVRYRRWIDTYADPGFAGHAARCAQMLDEAAPDPTVAREAFVTGMWHELAFWDAR